jgi:hypothetical protein
MFVSYITFVVRLRALLHRGYNLRPSSRAVRADNALRRAPAPHIAFTHDRARVGFDDAMDAKLKKRQAVPVAV